jgi:hypothetical protein
VIATAVAVAAAGAAGAAQLRPLPTAELTHLVRAVADPASVQRCSTARQVRYCLYPGFGRDLATLRAPVGGVLARLPARPAEPLTVRQVAGLDVTDLTLTHGQPRPRRARWNARVQLAPGTAATASDINVPVGSWPAAGRPLADARFELALATADWAVRLAPTVSARRLEGVLQPCVPLNQAREAIAIWLAIVATHPPAGELQAGLGGAAGFTLVGETAVADWADPGSPFGYLWPQGAGPQTTAAGYLLASAMTRLPEDQVARVLAGAWATWLNWHATDARLAAALGIPMPRVPVLPAGLALAPPGTAPGLRSAVCTG